MDETLFLRSNFSYGYNKVDNRLINNTDLSAEAALVVVRAFNYENQHPGVNMTQKLYSNIFGLSRFKTRKAYNELEANGYLVHKEIHPHKKATPDSTEENNGWIQHVYYWYADPSDNKGFKKEQYKKKCLEKRKKKDMLKSSDFIEQYNVNTIVEQNAIEKPSSISFEERNISIKAKDDFCKTIYMDVDSKIFHKIDMSDTMLEFIKHEITSDMFDLSYDDIIEHCWNIIVRADSYNESSYRRYRYSDTGIKMMNSVKAVILNRINNNKLYNEYLTNLPGLAKIQDIKERKAALKALVVKFSCVIANYVDLGYLLKDDKKRVPTPNEINKLFELLECHPEFICLHYSPTDYNVFHKFFKLEYQNNL